MWVQSHTDVQGRTLFHHQFAHNSLVHSGHHCHRVPRPSPISQIVGSRFSGMIEAYRMPAQMLFYMTKTHRDETRRIRTFKLHTKDTENLYTAGILQGPILVLLGRVQ